jgi:hypothetical protein
MLVHLKSEAQDLSRGDSSEAIRSGTVRRDTDTILVVVSEPRGVCASNTNSRSFLGDLHQEALVKPRCTQQTFGFEPKFQLSLKQLSVNVQMDAI